MSPAQRELWLAQRRLQALKRKQADAGSLREQERHVGSLWMDVELEKSAKRREMTNAKSSDQGDLSLLKVHYHGTH